MSAARVYLLDAVLIAGFFAASAAAFGSLPAAIPVHFGWSGESDAWAGTSAWSWFAVPLGTTACTAGIYLLSRLGRRKPGIYNLPRKAEFLALSASRRSQILTMLEIFLAWLTVAVTVEAAAVQLSVFSTATGRTDGLSLTTVVALIAGTAGLSLGGALFFQRLDERIHALYKEELAARGGQQ